MISARRIFLKKGVLGLLSVSLLPPSISLLSRRSPVFSVSGLFSQLSFKKKVLPPDQLVERFRLPLGEGEPITCSGTVFYSEKTLCVQEYDALHPGSKEVMMGVYEMTPSGYQKVVSLNRMELQAFSHMVTHLKNEHDLTDAATLQQLLIPRLRTGKHRTGAKGANGLNSSIDGYYTAQGYCSIKVKGKGNSYTIDTRLLNFRKSGTYHQNFHLRGLV